MKYVFPLLTLLLLVGCESVDQQTVVPAKAQQATLTELPFNQVSLVDLSAFKAVAPNWSIVGNVLSDYTKEQDVLTEAGTGVLVNQNDDTNRDNLFTTWEHADLELKVEVMVPKGSNSGVYFQGRYEIQLFDSWKKEQPTHADIGGIYQRWDDAKPEGEKGFEGHAPLMNASKAPGLWQELHIMFRAPRFDAAGNKIENARFEKVILNGKTIQENVELFGPTRASAFSDEKAMGPIMIQGDHGPVAFRNMQYKRYFDDSKLDITNLTYQYFEIDGPITQLPDFGQLQVVKEGTTDSLVYKKLSERDERVAYIFTGKLQVPKAGEYLFTVYSDDGSQLFINGEMLIDNDGKHDYEPKSGLVQLSEGSHDFKLDYFNNNWGQGLTVLFEGPEMRRQSLLSEVREHNQSGRPVMEVAPKESPEMVRSFLMHQGQKLTHAISVGDPAGLHYALDLKRGALLKFWRGDFADVTEMWYQRGQPQLLEPMAMSVTANAGHLAAVLSDMNASYPEEESEDFGLQAYDLNAAEQPVFRYKAGDAIITDHYQPVPDEQELIRTISLVNGVDNLYTRIAADEYIKAVGNGYYSIGGNYYIRLMESSTEPIIRQSNGKEEMLFVLTDSAKEVKYALLW